jgi:hypothetical protein
VLVLVELPYELLIALKSACTIGILNSPIIYDLAFIMFNFNVFMLIGRHVKNNACTVEIKIKWIKRKQMTHENTYHDDNTKKGGRPWENR